MALVVDLCQLTSNNKTAPIYKCFDIRQTGKLPLVPQSA